MWRPSSDLTDLAREASADEDTVLVFIEQEDAWFGVVRVDGEEDPRIYVSDAAAAARSSYGEILLTDELLGRDPATRADLDDLVDLDGTEDGEPDDDDDDEDADARTAPPRTVPPGPLGDAGSCADLGMSEKELLALAGTARSPDRGRAGRPRSWRRCARLPPSVLEAGPLTATAPPIPARIPTARPGARPLDRRRCASPWTRPRGPADRRRAGGRRRARPGRRPCSAAATTNARRPATRPPTPRSSPLRAGARRGASAASGG